jgi:hypothetical protein
MRKSLVITLLAAITTTTVLAGCGTTGPVGRTTPVPASPTVEVSPSFTPSPIARCKDGTYSYARVRSGACSGHGGVAVWWGPDKSE